jgi:Uma2 family endonuclease
MALSKAAAEALTQRLAAKTSPAPEGLPLLETGDHLTRHEFERRYNLTPEKVKAELIEGVVYMASPVRHKHHGNPHRQIITWLGNYCDATPGTDCSDNATLRLDADNEPQPDVQLFIEESAGGNVRITEDDLLEGSPELIVEIAASSASIVLHRKLHVYRRNGAQEYIVWHRKDNELDWFQLQEGQYVHLQPDAKGIIRSRVFPGLHLNVPALLAGEMKKVQAELQRGLSSKAHATFVKSLAGKASARKSES